ncbi:NAC domain-containing protein 41-like [Forsythia ovata]|uniref:NAC domain-containing protein 41-like n=1 Tax=Forsythia ovata TaxID=205694 RepID=A0ABD1U6A2_9LAMI
MRVALNLPHGFRFDPTDNEVLIFLRKNILDQQLPANVIPTADVYGTKLDELPLCEFKYVDESYWFIFTTKPNGNLVTEDGTKTCWNIHEYRVNPGTFTAAELNDGVKQKISNLVVCKIFLVKDDLFTDFDGEIDDDDRSKK